MNKRKMFVNILISFILVILIGLVFYNINNNLFLYDEIEYGKYYINENEYGKCENIKWIVVEKNDNSVLLLSKYSLDVIAYDKKDDNAKWGDSELRKFLNEEFYETTFSNYEKNNILPIERYIKYNDEFETMNDKVSLLSISDIEKLKIKNNILECRGTKYAIYKGLYLLSDNLVKYFIINDVKGEKYRYKKKLNEDYDYGLYGPFAYFSDEFVGANEEWVGIRPIIRVKIVKGKNI